MNRNDGIVVTGGQVQAGAIAAGRNAQARGWIGSAGEEELRAGLDRLAALVRENAEQIEDSEALVAALDKASEEASTAKPSRVLLTAIIDQVANSAKSVTAIVGAAVSLKDLIGQLF